MNNNHTNPTNTTINNNKPDPGPLATHIDTLRKSQGLTLAELANRSGVNRSQLTRIVSGETRQPTTETLNGIAKTLSIDPEELYDLASATGPLPSLPTYFRSKYNLSDQQIKSLEKAVDQMTDTKSKPNKTDNQITSPARTKTIITNKTKTKKGATN